MLPLSLCFAGFNTAALTLHSAAGHMSLRQQKFRLTSADSAVKSYQNQCSHAGFCHPWTTWVLLLVKCSLTLLCKSKIILNNLKLLDQVQVTKKGNGILCVFSKSVTPWIQKIIFGSVINSNDRKCIWSLKWKGVLKMHVFSVIQIEFWFA